MEKVIIVLLGLAAMVAADCGPMDRLKVKTEWSEVYGNAHHRIELGQQIFEKLFELDIKTKELFKRVEVDNIHSEAFKAHVARVMGGLDMCISLLEDEPTLKAQLSHLHIQHEKMKVQNPVFFSELGQVLLEVIPDWLDHSFDKDAWADCYNVISAGILGHPS